MKGVIMMNRRTALATFGSAGLGLLAMKLPTLGADPSRDDLLTAALFKFNVKSRARLLRVITSPGFSGQIPGEEVKAVCESEQKTVEAIMFALLPLAKTYSRPPISKYQVGTVVRGVSGDLFLGANIEFPGHSLGFSVHGEQSALSNAYMHGARGISAIAVTAAPCGHCRQFMNEVAPEGDMQVLVEGQSPMKLSSLLLSAFGPKDLKVADLAFPVKEADLARPNGTPDELTMAAWDAARKSYAPYTHAHSGVAIGTRAGRFFKGSYIENAAYNPSLPPLQTALAALIVAGGKYSDISDVVLVETDGAPISQRSVAAAVLGTIAPEVKLRVVTARLKT
jgi:cytidine deaminase